MSVRLVVAGISGRMGRTLVQTIHDSEGVHLSGALVRKGSALVGQDVGEASHSQRCGVIVSDDPQTVFQDADALLDFTTPAATAAFAPLVAQAKIAHMIGTTGLDPDAQEAVGLAAKKTAVVQSGNTSLGVNVLAAAVKRIAASLDISFDIEILEMHHAKKVDAPSGTALLLGEAAARGREISLQEASVRTRDGHTGPRPSGAIGFATLRGGTVVGDHSVIFAGPAERIVLSHYAEDRSIFARGAIHAALWAHRQPPGLYSMANVLHI